GVRDRRDGRRGLGGRRRARPDRRDGPPPHRARRRQAQDAARMNAAAWVCLLLPLGSALAITLADGAITRRVAGYVSTVTTMGAFAAAVVAFFVMLGEDPEERAHTTMSWTWLSAGPYHFGLTLLTDQLSVMMMLIVTGVGSLIVAYSVGYMDGSD